MEKLLFTPDEAAHALAIGRSKLYQLLQVGELESVHIRTCRRVPAAALSNYVERLQALAGGQVAAARLRRPGALTEAR
ncbi:MAG TPA: excisionase family DNA-binding protein [Mycobacteriales bacterium]|jgi:excisionase family DNA binding protein|nr:excisionase family DNA-binding protein [Mycobacteriales bacterium]